MNHDVTHCANYNRKWCPSHCYYAKLEEDLKNRSDLYYLPISYTSYINTSVCCLFAPTEVVQRRGSVPQVHNGESLI